MTPRTDVVGGFTPGEPQRSPVIMTGKPGARRLELARWQLAAREQVCPRGLQHQSLARARAPVLWPCALNGFKHPKGGGNGLGHVAAAGAVRAEWSWPVSCNPG